MVIHPDNIRHPNARPMTVDEIVEWCTTKLKPESALRNWDIGNWRTHVVSPLFQEVIDPRTDKPVALSRGMGRHAAVYGRVSSLQQRGDEHDDGYSIKEQYRSGIISAIIKGQAFRIYSDAGLSGFYTTNDAELIADVRRKHAKYYREAFEQVILRNADSWNTPEQIAGMRAFLDHHVRAIEIGEREAFAEWQEKQTDCDWHNIDLIFVIRYQHHKGTRFRPGLHALVEDIASIHTIFVTDPDRLSRNQALLLSLADVITKNDAKVMSSEGIVSWMHGEDLEDRLIGVITSHTAQEMIRKVKRRVLGGLVEMLRSGRPHSTLPFWIERDSNGYARRVEEKWPFICRVAELGKARPHLGEARIATKLYEEGWRSPTNPNHPKRRERRERQKAAGLPPDADMVISANSVGTWLRNPILFGSQVMMGREWPLRSSNGQEISVMSRAEFWAMHRKRQDDVPEARGRPAHTAVCNGFIICPCGRLMRMKRGLTGHSTPDRYRCTCPSTERRGSDIRHALFVPEELDAFFLNLILCAPDLFTGNVDDENSLEAQEKALQNHLEQQRQEAEKDARKQMVGITLLETDPAYQRMLSTLVNALIQGEEEKYNQAMERISRARIQKETREALQVAQRQSQIADIFVLAGSEQNAILKSYIQDARVSVNLDSLTIKLHSGPTLPTVTLRPERSRTSPVLLCHLPSIEEYILSLKAA